MLNVLMATHDGEWTLPRVLEAYTKLDPPEGGWKLLVVDNASRDATRQIVLSYAARLPLSYFFETSQSQNLARNRGLASLDGDLVVLTDDDAIPRPDWLVQMRRAADANPEFAMFGGVVRPRWEIPPPGWLLEWVPLAPCYALTDPAWEEGPIKSDFVFSPNMAIRVDVFHSGYRFDPRIGPRRGAYAMGSETELTRRLHRAGLRAWHCRDAVVEHIIRPVQMTFRWLMERARRYGRGQYRWTLAERHRPGRSIFGVPGRVVVSLLGQSARVTFALAGGDRGRLFKKCWIWNCLVGQILEARRVHRETRDRARIARHAAVGG